MAFVMKALGVVVVVAGFAVFVTLQKHMPSDQKQNLALSVAVAVVFVSAIYFALGVIVDKLDRIIRSLDRPEVSPSPAKSDQSPTEHFLASSEQPAGRHEPSL